MASPNNLNVCDSCLYLIDYVTPFDSINPSSYVLLSLFFLCDSSAFDVRRPDCRLLSTFAVNRYNVFGGGGERKR